MIDPIKIPDDPLESIAEIEAAVIEFAIKMNDIIAEINKISAKEKKENMI
jgi:hypothetical protein